MSERQQVKLTLKTPAARAYKRGDEEKTIWNFTTEDASARYVTFDDKFVEAFNARGCAGIEHTYVVIPDANGRPPMLQQIVGIYESKRGGGSGGRPGAPMFTDRQAALLAATVGTAPMAAARGAFDTRHVLRTADAFFAWLASGGKRDRVASDGAISGAAIDKREALERLQTSLATVFPGDGSAQKRWADDWCARINRVSVDDATPGEIYGAIHELGKLKVSA